MLELNNIIYSEWLKLKRSKITIIVILSTLIVPLLVISNSIQKYLKSSVNTIDLFGLYDNAIMFLMLLFAPLVMSVIATYLIIREYSEKTLKTIFAVPISRKQFLIGKFLMLFIIVILFMSVSWFNLLVLAIILNLFLNVNQITLISAIFFLIKMLISGTLLYMTITPIIYLSIRYKGFTIPFIVIASICFFNVILSNSSISRLFPWTATYLLVNRHNNNLRYTPFISLIIILLVCIISIIASIRRFLKEDII